MAKKAEDLVQNVKIRQYKNSFVLSWEQPGARFHVHCDAEHQIRGESLIYKNPPTGVDRYTEGYFQTRRLAAFAGNNARMFVAARQIADRDGLWQAAIDTYRAEQLAEGVNHIRAGIAHAKNAAGAQLFAALSALVYQLERSNAVDDHGHAISQLKTLGIAREALTAAKPTTEVKAAWLELYGRDAIDAAIKEESSND